MLKSPEIGFASPWHQDWPYWWGAHNSSVWIALDEATPDNGCLKMLPGSHRHASSHSDGKTDGHGFGHRIDLATIDVSRSVTVPVTRADGTAGL